MNLWVYRQIRPATKKLSFATSSTCRRRGRPTMQRHAHLDVMVVRIGRDSPQLVTRERPRERRRSPDLASDNAARQDAGLAE